MEGMELVKKAVKILDDKKGIDIKIIKISALTIMADYFIIVSGTSGTHVRALADEVDDALRKEGIEPRTMEGRSTGWILIDYNDVVVHVFTPQDREYYGLERLWSDASIIDASEFLSE